MYRKVVTVIQKVLDLLTGLRKIRENIPRKEAVSDVFRERREFVSINLVDPASLPLILVS